MNRFISIHNLVFGCHLDIALVPIHYLATAVEISTTYHWDDFGRFGVTNGKAKEKILCDLAKFHTARMAERHKKINEPFYELLDDGSGWHPLARTQPWLYSGWFEDDLPDFEACNQQWVTQNGMAGQSVPPLQRLRIDPFPQNHIWNLMSQILKLTVGDEAHQLIKKDVYREAVSALENKGLRWGENEKPALRRHLKAIVANAQK